MMRNLPVVLKHSLFAVVSGVMLWLSWPERGWTPLIFVALIPLLWIERHFEREKGVRNHFKVFGWFFLAMLTWNSLSTWWIWNSTSVGTIVALGLNSFLMTLVWQLFYITKRDHGPAIGYMSLPFYWIGFEYLHLNWEVSWPWLTLGNVFAVRTEWVQWYEYTGVLGGTLWIIGVNIILFQITKNLFTHSLLLKVRQANTILLSFSALLLIAVPIDASYHMYERRQDQGTPVEVAVVQPNIDPYNEKFNGTSDEQLNKQLQLASTVVDSQTQFVIGPETALPDGIWEEELAQHPHTKRIRKFLGAFPGLNMITGVTTFKRYENGEKPSLTARKFKNADSYYDVYNSALLLDSSENLQVYHKSKLVPGVEKMPYPQIFGFLEKFAIELGGTSGSLGIQTNRSNFISRSGVQVAPAICYESIYGDFMSGYIRNGAQFIAVITNDGWWGNTPGYRQHMNYARLLAIQFRKSVARSANTGISCFINQRGDVVQRTQWWEPDAIRNTVYLNDKITFYARFGDYLGFVAAFISVSFFVFILLKRMLRFV